MSAEEGWYISFYYVPNGGSFSSGVYASSKEEAEQIADTKGTGEGTIMYHGPQRPHQTASELVRAARQKKSAQKLREALHCAVYEGFLAASAGVIDAKDLLCDEGIIHNTVHALLALSGDWDTYSTKRYEWRSRRIVNIIAGLEDMEARIPGYLSRKEKKNRGAIT